jgi:hypothetical protein
MSRCLNHKEAGPRRRDDESNHHPIGCKQADINGHLNLKVARESGHSEKWSFHDGTLPDASEARSDRIGRDAGT